MGGLPCALEGLSHQLRNGKSVVCPLLWERPQALCTSYEGPGRTAPPCEGTLWHRSAQPLDRTRWPLLDDHLDHIIAERGVETLRHLIGGRDLLADLELRPIIGDTVDVGVGRDAQPHVRACGLLDQQPPPLL